jgi:EAL domain-containing protein (putative c-di-GMP-specific phosphodiesterase class I)
VNLATGRIDHVEALVRWMNPERGLVSPDKFIPFAEHTGFIKHITKWVIEEAFRQTREWERNGLLLKVSINISARDLFIPKFPEFVQQLMSIYQVSSKRIGLEITESAMMTDPKLALTILNALHDLGLELSVDDFGTGYSSLAYLKKLPVSELKIDQSFVSGMENDQDSAMIVRSTIDLAHNMGLNVVAEGVENQATWALLKQMGCDLIQGYYVSRPIAAEALPAWLTLYHSDHLAEEKNEA